jgi:HEAT repeat protein
MRRILTALASLALVSSAPPLVASAFAHGGSYRGPAGEVPPDSREPSDPPPPPEGGGPQTPGGEQPGGPTTGGPEVGGPTTPGGGGAGGPATGGAPSSGGPSQGGGGGGAPTTSSGGKRPAARGLGYEDWTFWWNYNKDEILQLKSAVKKMQTGPKTGSTGVFGGGRSSVGKAIKSPTEEAIQTKIVPLLRELLEASPKDISFHIQGAAELGLAKIGDETIVETLKKMALNSDKEYPQEVVESAGLGFGLLQKDTPEIRAFLIDLVKDQSKDGTRLRSFSAIALGLLQDKNDKDKAALTAMFEVVSRKEPGVDVQPACLLSVGLNGNDTAVPELMSIATTGKSSLKGALEVDDTAISYAIGALGKIGRPGLDGAGKETVIVDALMTMLEKGKKLGTNPRRSAAIALGQIGPACGDSKVQRKVVDTLRVVADDAEDTQERNFAIMSLGRIGATKGVDADTRKNTIVILKKQLEKGKGLTPPFAALALGLIGRQIADETGSAPEDEIRKPLREKFEKQEGEPRSLGAYAIASGLVRDPLAVPKMLEYLKNKGGDKKTRGYCAVALGMIGSLEAGDAIKSALKDDADRELRTQTAVAAGLLNDPTAIKEVVGILTDPNSSNYELGSAALALGQIGDESAISALTDIVKDKKFPDLTRALATVALGQIGDRRDVPTLARLATDINYRAHVPAITELLDIL